MSQKLYEALEKAREEALERQQRCAYCDQICKNADHLVAHIRLRHPEETR
jgi:hypothetical protein